MNPSDPHDPRPPMASYAVPPGYHDQVRADVVDLLPVGITGLLDVGCGSGGFLRLVLDRRGDLAVAGIESDPGAAAAAAADLGVRCGSFPDDVGELPDAIDCVVFNDVLEHMVNPWSALHAAAEIVGPNGWLIASLPNLRNLDTLRELAVRGDFRYRSQGVLDVTHLRFFTLRSAQRLLTESGWEVVSSTPTGRLRSRKLVAIARTVGLIVPWFRREGQWRQLVLVARPTRT